MTRGATESMVIEPAFAPLADKFFGTVRTGHGGGALAVYQHGKPVLDVWAGEHTGGDQWRRDSIALSYSTGKGVAATVVHRLADRGLIEYDAAVADYWLEFAASGKSTITVRELLNHRAGLHRVRGLVPKGCIDHDVLAEALATSPADARRRLAQGYHAVSFGTLVAELVQRVTGEDFCDVVRTEIAEPLGEQDYWFRVPADQRHRVVRLAPKVHIGGLAFDRVATSLAWTRVLNGLSQAFLPEAYLMQNDPLVHDVVQPGWNGVFSARALAKMYGAIGGAETVGGHPFLKPETLAAISTMPRNSRYDYVLGASANHWLGYHRALMPRGFTRNAFGHNGTGGSGGYVFPALGLSIGFVTSRLGGRMTSAVDMRLADFSALAERIARPH